MGPLGYICYSAAIISSWKVAQPPWMRGPADAIMRQHHEPIKLQANGCSRTKRLPSGVVDSSFPFVITVSFGNNWKRDKVHLRFACQRGPSVSGHRTWASPEGCLRSALAFYEYL